MPTLRLETCIAAPIDRVFDAARDIEFHQRTMAWSSERAVDGVTSGLIGFGESVTWEGRHFGLRMRHTAKIAAYDRPHSFVDVMERGAFKSFEHTHLFYAETGGTRMVDVLVYRAPLGPLGWLAEKLLLQWYLRRLLDTRAQVLKHELEKACRNSTLNSSSSPHRFDP